MQVSQGEDLETKQKVRSRVRKCSMELMCRVWSIIKVKAV